LFEATTIFSFPIPAFLFIPLLITSFLLSLSIVVSFSIIKFEFGLVFIRGSHGLTTTISSIRLHEYSWQPSLQDIYSLLMLFLLFIPPIFLPPVASSRAPLTTFDFIAISWSLSL